MKCYIGAFNYEFTLLENKNYGWLDVNIVKQLNSFVNRNNLLNEKPLKKVMADVRAETTKSQKKNKNNQSINFSIAFNKTSY